MLRLTVASIALAVALATGAAHAAQDRTDVSFRYGRGPEPEVRESGGGPFGSFPNLEEWGFEVAWGRASWPAQFTGQVMKGSTGHGSCGWRCGTHLRSQEISFGARRLFSMRKWEPWAGGGIGVVHCDAEGFGTDTSPFLWAGGGFRWIFPIGMTVGASVRYAWVPNASEDEWKEGSVDVGGFHYAAEIGWRFGAR